MNHLLGLPDLLNCDGACRVNGLSPLKLKESAIEVTLLSELLSIRDVRLRGLEGNVGDLYLVFDAGGMALESSLVIFERVIEIVPVLSDSAGRESVSALGTSTQDE